MHRQKPRLKNGVDLQLQSAFSEENWAIVSRLAEKRAKALKDQYYEILKICAESQLDDPAVKLSALAAVQQYVKDGTVVKDVEAIDLLEWATLDLVEEDDFLETLGPLRTRCVKAAPKDKLSASRCLESCLVHWDLSSAQQIAAILDRSFPQERHFMFWNIAITHMLSMSPQSTPDKKKLYGMLAQKQIERAAQVTEQASSSADETAKPPPRSIQTEEEILLLYAIVEAHGSSEDFEKLVTGPVFSPLAQFCQGRKELLLRVIARYRQLNDWDAIFGLCKDCLSYEDETGQHNLLACDFAIWEEFITAASHLQSTNQAATKEVQDLLLKLVKAPNLRPIYRRNLLLARVSAAFRLVPFESEDVVEDRIESLRLRELAKYIEDQVFSPACFDDIKGFVEQLDCPGLMHLTNDFMTELRDRTTDARSLERINVLKIKIKYLATTCPQMYTGIPGDNIKHRCTWCEGDSDFQSCQNCFSNILKSALELYQTMVNGSQHSLVTDEATADLIILVVFCCIKLACPDPSTSCTTLLASSRRHIFQALLLLEHHLAFSPKNSQFLLLLLQLHLLVGSAPRSRQLFDDLTVKRTIMDSLGPLFYDRLSTLAPNLISPSDDRGWQLMDGLTSHYSVSLKLRMPRRLVDAFESESYSSVIDIPKYITDLRTSCTRAISCIEETRSERMLGCPTWELLSDARYTEITDNTNLKPVIDYGSFPSWDSSACSPVYARLRIGPTPTNRRLHLSLLAEAYHDALGYKAPSMYKLSIDSIPSDETFLLESLCRIANSIARFLPGPNTDLTSPEQIYFQTVSLLSSLVSLCAGGARSPSLEEAAIQMLDAAKAALETLHAQIQYTGDGSVEDILSLLGSMHTVGTYRDTASALTLAANFLLSFHDRAKERDRSGQSNLPKEIVAKLKILQSDAATASRRGKDWTSGAKTYVKGDFIPKFRTWVFEGCSDDFREIVEDAFVVELVAELKENIEGWQRVKWE